MKLCEATEAFTNPAFYVLHFQALQFHVLHFHVVHFQCPRRGHSFDTPPVNSFSSTPGIHTGRMLLESLIMDRFAHVSIRPHTAWASKAYMNLLEKPRR